MQEQKLKTIIGWFTAFTAAIVYVLTVQPSVSFWDCGEFIASAYLMQVPHPPGTPFFLMLGKLFSLIPFAENIAYRVNMVSVISSVFTVFFLYHVAIKAIENYKGKKHTSLFDSLATYISASVGALSLAFADTFWFNAVEAEVYAASVFFIAIVSYLMMLWNEQADELDNEKYLILIAYLIGLSIGVHLMAVLSIVSVVMVIMFRKFIDDENYLKESGKIFLIHTLIILVYAFFMWASQKDSVPPSAEEYKQFDQRFFTIAAVITGIFSVFVWKKIFNKNSFYFPLILGGIALILTYPGTVKYFPNLIASLGGNNIVLDILIIIGIFAVIFFVIFWSKNNNKQTIHLLAKAFLFMFLGYTTYTSIIIRSNQDTPINLNSPKTFEELVSYLNREQYGDFPTFKRRYASEPHQQIVFNNYTSDLDFFSSYQMHHMYHRYLLWNYAGRESTVQDSGVNWYQLWGIPFLLGLLGIYFHFRRDWKMASVFMTMFIFLGYLTVFYQNQQQPQPRERDYFYVGAFFVYSVWIAFGVRGIIDEMIEKFNGKSFLKAGISGVLILSFILVPIKMLATNYFEHNRSRNFVPWDYSYNLLQSAAPNAILFTNGDNDTFPLWYLQDVEGVRRDVRIANLSLLNTPWYIKQLKNTEPHGAQKIKLTFSDEQIENIGPSRWEPRDVSIPVPESVLKEYGVNDSLILANQSMTWRMNNTAQFGDIKVVRVQDILVLDIIRSNTWDRPIYFSVTCAEDSKIGLEDYLEMEGMALRLTPSANNSFYDNVNRDLMYKNLLNEPDGFSKNYQPGFKFRGLNDPTVFFDENHARLTTNYRNSFIRLALAYLHDENKAKVTEVLDSMEVKIPRNIIPIDFRILYDVASIYYQAGASDKFLEVTSDLEKIAWEEIDKDPSNLSGRYSPYAILKDIYEKNGMFNKLVQLFKKLKELAPNDPEIDRLINRYQNLSNQRDSINQDIQNKINIQEKE